MFPAKDTGTSDPLKRACWLKGFHGSWSREGKGFTPAEKYIRRSVCARRKDTLCLRPSALDSIELPRDVRLAKATLFTLHSTVKISDSLHSVHPRPRCSSHLQPSTMLRFRHRSCMGMGDKKIEVLRKKALRIPHYTRCSPLCGFSSLRAHKFVEFLPHGPIGVLCFKMFTPY